jgi:hypothetical protein
MPLTGLLFVLYVGSIVALSISRDTATELRWLILAHRFTQALLLFSILYLCRCSG